MLTIKLLVYLAAMLVTIGFFFNSFSILSNSLFESSKEFSAKLKADSCATIINSFYSNPEGTLSNLKTNCYLKSKNSVAVNFEGTEKTSFILNNSTKISQGKNSLAIEVAGGNRYEK